MWRLNGLSRQAALWVGSVAILVPLAILLVFQYRWLVSLEETSAIARQSALENYLEAVTSEVRYFYATNAERVLNLPPSYFVSNDDGELFRHHFEVRHVQGAKWFFVVVMNPVEPAEVMFYDPRCNCWGEPEEREMLGAVHVASAPWVMMSYQRSRLDSVAWSVDEKNPELPVLINPIVDEESRVVGLAGLVIDREHFESTVLPATIDHSLPRFFSETRAVNDLLLTVSDSRGRLVYCNGPDGAVLPEAPGEVTASRSFSPFFSQWTVSLRSGGFTPQEWARSNFALNVSLSVLLGVVLVGGTTFTLRTASREIRLSQMKSDFVSNVSHELRTPLASIRAFGELLKLGRVGDREKASEYGEYIEVESRRLTQLINNILDFSRIESGGKEYDFEVADLVAVVRETVRTFEVRSRQLDFEVLVETAQAGGLDVRLDRSAMAQAIANLLENAVKYSAGSRRVIVRVGPWRGQAVVSVQDFGIGITAMEQKRIFERFHRVSSALEHDVKGAGLGLAIVHHIVHAHGGRVRVRSSEGSGSTFSILLPLYDARLRAGGSAE